MKFNVHGGHNSHVTGASKYLNELNEDRKVKNEVIRLLKAQGHTVYDCTDDSGTTQNANLSNIVKKCNAHSVDLDISIHLNAGGGTGVEAYIYPNSSAKDEASRICSKVSGALGIKNRGVKTSTSLYVLKQTKAPAVLVECCFVDNKIDKEKWDANKCAKAIVEGILNKTISTSTSKPSKPATTNKRVHATYRVKTKKHGWLSPVTDWNDYAGWENSDIVGLALKVSAGSVKYRVHVKGGGWLPYVTGYNTNDHNNGYAGNGKTIDAIEIYYNTPSNIRPYKRACYKVNNYPAQYDNEKVNGMDGYAGAFGVAIKKVWIKIV